MSLLAFWPLLLLLPLAVAVLRLRATASTPARVPYLSLWAALRSRGVANRGAALPGWAYALTGCLFLLLVAACGQSWPSAPLAPPAGEPSKAALVRHTEPQIVLSDPVDIPASVKRISMLLHSSLAQSAGDSIRIGTRGTPDILVAPRTPADEAGDLVTLGTDWSHVTPDASADLRDHPISRAIDLSALPSLIRVQRPPPGFESLIEIEGVGVVSRSTDGRTIHVGLDGNDLADSAEFVALLHAALQAKHQIHTPVAPQVLPRHSADLVGVVPNAKPRTTAPIATLGGILLTVSCILAARSNQ